MNVLKDIIDYHLGNGEYDFSHLPADQRENASHDAWVALFERIKFANRTHRLVESHELERLKNRDEFLLQLEYAGVDNWDGYSAAHEAFEEEHGAGF